MGKFLLLGADYRASFGDLFCLRRGIFVLKGHAFRVVFREPGFRGVGIREHLEVISVADLLAGVDIDENGHWSLFSFRLPQCVSLRSGLNTRST